MQWVIQKNYLKPQRFFDLKSAFDSLNYKYLTFKSEPDNPTLPVIPINEPTIFFLTTFMINPIAESKLWNPGVYFNEENFCCSKYREAYKENFLSYNCYFTFLEDFKCDKYKPNDKFFIRPNKDLKAFTGMVIEFREMLEWNPEKDTSKNFVDPSTLIMVSFPQKIEKEWRIFIVDGKVSSGSQYSQDMEFKVEAGVPDDVKEFSEAMAKMWSPSEIFTLDICKVNGILKVLECNCFNCSGFYNSDVKKIILDVERYNENRLTCSY